MSLFPAEESEGAPCKEVQVTAVGGCGLAVLNRVASRLGDTVRTLAIDTDRASLFESEAGDHLLLGEILTEGHGTGGDEGLAVRSIAGRNVEIREAMSGPKANLLIGGLGGGTATALLPELAKISRSTGMLTLVFATRPFHYEGKAKTVLAKRRMHSLVRAADAVFIFANDHLAGEGSGKLSAAEAVKRSDTAITEAIEGILDFILPRRRLLLDFGTVKSFLTRGGLSAYSCGISAMRNNAIEAFRAAVDMFARHKSDITKAPRALVQFAIDDDVLMDGVRNAFGVAQRVFSKDAQLAMGVVFNGLKQGKTRVSIIACGLPLYNEVVDQLPTDERAREIESAASEGGRRRPAFQGNDKLRVLNPRRLNEEELKIPAYLRRRMMSRETKS
jgi:cell division protein FtsZ